MFHTYVLQSEKDDKFYVGFTKDLKLRPARLNPSLRGCGAAFNWVKEALQRKGRLDKGSETIEADIL